MKRFLFLSFFLLAACDGDPDFTAVTNAPPGAVAEVHTNRSNHSYAIRVTEGVSVAVDCKDAKERPCGFDGTTIADESTATFRRAYADLQNVTVYSRGYQQESSVGHTVFVVTGKKPGATTMRVITGYGDVDVNVEVLPTGTK